MATENYLKSKLKEFERNEVFGRDEVEKRMADLYIGRARHNIVVMKNSLEISTSKEVKDKLGCLHRLLIIINI